VADSFEHFFKEHYREVEHRLRGAGASSHVAAEATQEAFVRAYQRWWRIGHYQNPAAWVQKVARNYRIDMERHERRQSTLFTSIEVNQQSDEDSNDHVEFAVDALPPQQQTAVRAVYTQGLTTTETAEEMGISQGAVRFHLHRARNTLRPMLSSDTAGQEV
jgi:RNA polymerase sigma-70 factor (ECF subfamily)